MGMKKRILTLLVAVALAVGMCLPAYGATVTNDTTEHTYDAYQVFKGTQAEGDSALGDVEWGSGVNGTELLKELKSIDIYKDCVSPEDVANVLSNYRDKSNEARAFANVAVKHLTEDRVSIGATATSVDLEAGYWLLVDSSNVAGKNDANNPALLQVTEKGNITIDEKYNVPTVDKAIVERSSTVEATDANIGDDIKFRLEGTLPSDYADYESYKYIFHDTLSSGLTYNNDVKVYVVNEVDGAESRVEVTTFFDVAKAPQVISCSDLKAITTVNDEAVVIAATSKIVVEYSAGLNSGAQIGSEGNPNTVCLEYSNNPNWNGTPGASDEPTGKTPEDEVIVFTYKLNVTKVDAQDKDNSKLADAEFILLNSDKTKIAKVTTAGVLVEWVEGASVKADADGTYPAEYTLKSGTDGVFAIQGLDAGGYYLKETKAPAGYNLLKDPIPLVIEATLDVSEDNPALTALSIEVNNGESVAGNLTTGEVKMTVENNKGPVLPETGGMGTTLFYIVGGILVVGAAALLIARRRSNSED